MKKRIGIRGMSCQHCVATVITVLEEIEGIENVSVSLERAEATYDEREQVTTDRIREQLRRAGYELA